MRAAWPVICQCAEIAVEIAREKSTAVTVRRVEPGSVRIGRETYTENVLIFRNEVRRDIEVDDAATLGVNELDDLLNEQPDIVILGTGWQARRPPRELTFALARRGIGFESMDTPAACRTFNILSGEGRDVAAILIIRD